MTYNFTSKIVVLTSVPHLVLAWNFSHWKHSHWAYSSSEKHRAFSGIHEQRPASSVFEPELLFFTNSLFVVHFPALLSSWIGFFYWYLVSILSPACLTWGLQWICTSSSQLYTAEIHLFVTSSSRLASCCHGVYGSATGEGQGEPFSLTAHTYIYIIYIFIYYILYVYRIQSDVGLQPVLQLCLKCMYQGISPFAHMRQDASSRKSRDGQLDWFGFIDLKVVLLSALCPHPHQGMQMCVGHEQRPRMGQHGFQTLCQR